jgi:hypothetical protein
MYGEWEMAASGGVLARWVGANDRQPLSRGTYGAGPR